MTIPQVLVEIDPGDGWQDVTSYVDLVKGISIDHGRPDELSIVAPGRAALTLDNSTGKFTGYAADAIGMGLRVSADYAGAQNLADAQSASFETVAYPGAWVQLAGTVAVISNTTRAWSGTRSMRVIATVANSVVGIPDLVAAFGLVLGRTYRFTVRVYAPSGLALSPAFPWAQASVAVDRWVTVSQVVQLTPDLNALTLTADVAATFYVDGLQIEDVTHQAANRLAPDTAEGVPAGWQATSATLTGDAIAWHGTGSLKVDANGGAQAVVTNVFSAMTAPVTPGAAYTISAYVRVPSTLGVPWTIGVRWLQSATLATISEDVNPANPIQASTGTGWVRVSWTATAPYTAAFAQVLIESVGTAPTTDIFYVDGVMFTQGTALEDFPDPLAAYVPNIAPNSCLETSADHWFVTYGTGGSGTSARVADVTAPSGSGYVVRATWTVGTSAVGGYLYITTAIGSAVPGTWSFRARAMSNRSQRLYLFVTAFSSGGGSLGLFLSAEQVVAADQWATFTINGATAPANTSYFAVFVAAVAGTGAGNWVAGDTLSVSAVQVEQAATVSPAFNGFTAITAGKGRRFTGRITSFPISWPGGRPGYSQVDVRASDRMADLARIPLGSIIDETIRFYAPTAYYPLGEPRESLSAGDVSGYGRPALAQVQRGSGGTIDFSSGTGPGTDGHGAPQFKPVDATNGRFLKTLFPVPTPYPGTTFSWHVTANTAAVRNQMLMRVGPAEDTAFAWELSYDSTGHLWVSALGTAIVVADGLTHDIVVTGVLSVGTWTVTIHVDSVPRGGGTFPTIPQADSTRLDVGGGPFGATFDGTISHVALFDKWLTDAAKTDMWNAVNNGFSSDLAHQRIARYLGFAGVPARECDFETSVTAIQHLEITGKSVLDACQAVAETEGGTFFSDGAGRIIFHTRTHRYSRPSVLTLDAESLATDTQFNLDNQGLTNLVEVSTPAGAKQSYADPPSIAARGLRPEKLQRLMGDAAALSAAQWRVNTYKDPGYRLADVEVDLLTAAGLLPARVQGLQIDDTITVAGLPSQAPASTVSLIVEGWAEKIALTDWSLHLNTSPASLSGCLVLDDPLYGLLDTSNRIAY